MASNNPFEPHKGYSDQGDRKSNEGTPKRQPSPKHLDAARGLTSSKNTRSELELTLAQLAQSAFETKQRGNNSEGELPFARPMLPYEIQNPLKAESKQERQMNFGRWLNRNESARNEVAENFKNALGLMDGNEPLLKSMISSLPVETSASLLFRYCTCRLRGLVQLNEVQVHASTEPDRAQKALAELKWQTDEIHRFSQSLQDLYGSSSGSGQIEPPKNEIYDPKNLSNRLQSLEAYINSFDFGKVKDGQSERQFCDRIKRRVEMIIAERDRCEGDKYTQAKAREFEKHAHYHLLLLDKCKEQLEAKEQHAQTWFKKAESVLEREFCTTDDLFGDRKNEFQNAGKGLDTEKVRDDYHESIKNFDKKGWNVVQSLFQEKDSLCQGLFDPI